ncbi:hypothetical protein [Erwinia sp. 198]|uniref:hypothetical protein n=1 Tax=Erwinia sp. 198 TaxID=2022746 RepID=UPI000F681F34|nr:hypothetical protein [Erwinia sp. 198]RRZ95579.1 hypothetical protein EGK14_03215 [Erwinia sp. 198]
MICRFTLAVAMAAITLTGCTSHKKDEPATTSITASAKDFFKGPPVVSAEDFSTGPTQVDVSHVTSRTDDGSAVYVTVDGKDAGALIRGQSLQLHLPAGEHQVGGYVPTLLGFGRVTIPAVKVTTTPEKVKKVAYTTGLKKPAFTETDAGQG